MSPTSGLHPVNSAEVHSVIVTAVVRRRTTAESGQLIIRDFVPIVQGLQRLKQDHESPPLERTRTAAACTTARYGCV